MSVGDGTWVGTRALILPGVHIGAGCVVAAGAVVTESVPDDTMVGGVPARVAALARLTAGQARTRAASSADVAVEVGVLLDPPPTVGAQPRRLGGVGEQPLDRRAAARRRSPGGT